MTMTTRKTCDKCAHYSPPDNWRSDPNQGDCALMGDSNDGLNAPDKVQGWDYEGYRAGTYVGPKFGCIHWEKKSMTTHNRRRTDPVAIIDSPSYVLSLVLTPCTVGHHLQLVSFMSEARRPENQVQFDVVLTLDELHTLHAYLGRYLLPRSNS